MKPKRIIDNISIPVLLHIRILSPILQTLLENRKMIRYYILHHLKHQKFLPRPKIYRLKLQVFSEIYELEIFHDAKNKVIVNDRTKLKFIFGANKNLKKKNNIKKKRILGGIGTKMNEIMKILEVFRKDGKKLYNSILIHGTSGTGKSTLLELIGDLWGGKGVIEIHKRVNLGKRRNISEIYMMLVEEIMEEVKGEEGCVLLLWDDFDEFMKLFMKQKNNRLVHFVSRKMLDVIREKKVMLFCSCKDLSKIPLSMRRIGRIEKEIELKIPTEEERKEIIKVYLDDDSVIDILASSSHGYVGADLKFLCDEYKMEILSNSLDKNKEVICKKILRRIKPTVVKDIQITIPKIHWKDIGGQDYLKKNLIECVEWQFKYKDKFEAMNIRPPRGILLYGPPGCSKTLAAKALATECRMNFLCVKGPELFSKWVGESEKAVKRLFERARKASPCIVFFDEIDGLAVERGSDSQNTVGDRVLSQLLSEMDGIRELNDVTLVGATNRPDLLDAALLRPGRIDRMIYVKPPDLQSRIEILNIYLGKVKNNVHKETVVKIAENTKDYSGAELCAIVKESAFIALEHYMDLSKELETKETVIVTEKDLFEAKTKIMPRITKEMLQFYENFEKKYRFGNQ